MGEHLSEKLHRASAAQRSGRFSGQHGKQTQMMRDRAEFRLRMLRLAVNVRAWLADPGLVVALREMMMPEESGAAVYCLPGLVIRRGGCHAGLLPQAMYGVRGHTQIKGEACLTVDNPRRRPRTQKFMLCMGECLSSTADWVLYPPGGDPSEGQVLTRERFLMAVATLCG